MKKTPAVVRAKVMSLKMRKSGQTFPPTLGGNRLRIRRFAKTRRMRKIRASRRTDQAYPRRGKRDWRARGKMIPPTEPPVAARPVAMPRRREKKWVMEPIAGVKIREVPRPPRTEKVRIKCQNSGSSNQPTCLNRKSRHCLILVLSLKPIIPTTRQTVPPNTSHRGPLASKTGPICKPHPKARKM